MDEKGGLNEQMKSHLEETIQKYFPDFKSVPQDYDPTYHFSEYMNLSVYEEPDVFYVTFYQGDESVKSYQLRTGYKERVVAITTKPNDFSVFDKMLSVDFGQTFNFLFRSMDIVPIKDTNTLLNTFKVKMEDYIKDLKDNPPTPKPPKFSSLR